MLCCECEHNKELRYDNVASARRVHEQDQIDERDVCTYTRVTNYPLRRMTSSCQRIWGVPGEGQGTGPQQAPCDGWPGRDMQWMVRGIIVPSLLSRVRLSAYFGRCILRLDLKGVVGWPETVVITRRFGRRRRGSLNTLEVSERQSLSLSIYILPIKYPTVTTLTNMIS